MVAVLMNNSNVDDLSSLRLTPHEPHLFLVVEGDDPAAGGARYSLRDVHEVIIGHGPERRAQREVSNGHARLSLRIPGSFIAPKHSRIVRRGGRWWLEDGGSEGGTLLNGARVELAALVDGD